MIMCFAYSAFISRTPLALLALMSGRIYWHSSLLHGSVIARSVSLLVYGVSDWGSIPGKVRELFFATAFKSALRSNQPPIQRVPGALSLGLNWPGNEANHSPPSSVEVKNVWSYISDPSYVFIAWYVIKHRDNFTSLYLYIYCFIHFFVESYIFLPFPKRTVKHLLVCLCLSVNK